MANELNQIIHVFEQAGLGKAPFFWVGMETKKFCASPGAPVQPGSTCDFCGTGIMECCIIKSSDGKRFKVGVNCVNKTGDKGLINPAKRAANARRAEAKREKETALLVEARATFSSHTALRAYFEAMPHPYAWRAEKGENFLHYYDYQLNNASWSANVSAAQGIDYHLRQLQLSLDAAQALGV